MPSIMINEMELPVPDGFRILTKEERRRLNILKEGEGEILQDEERHIMISAAWKKHGLLAGLLAGEKEAAQAMEKQIAAGMKAYGYERETWLSEDLGGRKAEAFTYHYNAQGTEMSAESLLLKKDRTYYYVHCYYRTALKEESRQVIRNIFENITWKE